MDKKTFDKGVEVRTAVLGKAYVENALKNVEISFLGKADEGKGSARLSAHGIDIA